MRVAVVMGGRSTEHDVSLRSGQQVMNAIADQRPLPVVIGKDGRWVIDGQPARSIGEAIDRLVAEVEVVFIALHGPHGEDGTIQGLFETVGLAYTGSGVLGSALAMDKVRAKLVYQVRGLPTAPFEVLSPKRWREEKSATLAAIGERIGYPAVFKVARGGSSVGVTFPKDAAELERAVSTTFRDSDLALVERFVKGRELTCGVLEDAEQGTVFALPVTEIVPDARYAFFDYEAKYTPGATQEITPARVSPEIAARVQALALAAHQWLDCRDFSRTDVMIGENDQPVVLETNTIPGLTAQSLLPQAAAVAGYPFPKLIALLLNNARHRRRASAR